MDQATAPTARQWRSLTEGIQIGCTAQGSKDGFRKPHFIVARAYIKGAVPYEQCFSRLSCGTMADIECEHFPSMFERSANTRQKCFLQDGCFIQNLVSANIIYDETGAFLFYIPPRILDLSPVKFFFFFLYTKIRKDTIKRDITERIFTSFSQRVKILIQIITKRTINCAIDSKDKWIKMVLRA